MFLNDILSFSLVRSPADEGEGGGTAAAEPEGAANAPAAPSGEAPAPLIGEEPATAAPPEFTPWEPEAITEILPEGFTTTPEQAAALAALVNEAKGDQKALVTGMLKYYTEVTSSEVSRLETESAGLVERMQAEVKADPEVGGAKLEESLRLATQVANRFGGKDFVGLLQATGAANSIHMVRFLTKIGAALPAEGRPVNGAPAGPPKTLAERMFPNNPAG